MKNENLIICAKSIMEMKVMSNSAMQKNNLLINVEGSKRKQHITSENLIRNCKLKKTVLDRAWKGVESKTSSTLMGVSCENRNILNLDDPNIFRDNGTNANRRNYEICHPVRDEAKY